MSGAKGEGFEEEGGEGGSLSSQSSTVTDQYLKVGCHNEQGAG